MIERSRVRVPAEAAGEFFSPGSTFCADSVLVKFSETERGPGYCKFNNSLLKDSIFVNQMNAVFQ